MCANLGVLWLQKYCLLSDMIEEDVIGLKILRATININVASNE